jgi:UDP-N-acetylglucosamine--N-acetylmuramyl-(pentapeptide) pyrophosphoryl-undecaprenol N-acetylglucosamine transferase
MSTRTALVMAGGTGGHIFPGLAVAEVLRSQGWRVHWLGAPAPSMESQLVPAKGFAFEAVRFGGVRGKGLLTLALLPMRLLQAFWQSLQVIRRLRPDVLVGLGGYITFPGGMMGVLMGKPLVLHEQNSVAGMANKVLALVADRVLSTFPKVLPKAQWVGNPMREAFLNQATPQVRFAQRTGPLRVLVVGGSLGAQALNSCVPQALALIPAEQRPLVLHQGGAKHLQTLQDNYERAGVEASLVPFIDDTASAFADADLVICRAGASTVSELAAVGAAALLVPFPHAVDDHQTVNAQFLTTHEASWLMPQSELSPQKLAAFLMNTHRPQLLAAANKAYALRKTAAAMDVARACTEVLS